MPAFGYLGIAVTFFPHWHNSQIILFQLFEHKHSMRRGVKSHTIVAKISVCATQALISSANNRKHSTTVARNIVMND